MSAHRLTRRDFLVGAGLAAASLPFARLHAADNRPNFVFILTDDQRYDAMSCAGHPFLHTPSIDRIAGEGARFTNAFVTTSLCSPSRASFLSGLYANSHGIQDNRTPMSDDIPTFPQLLQEAGYDTAYIGKWHMGSQEGPRKGFNRWVSFRGQGPYFDPMLNIDGENVKTYGYMTDILTKHAVEWLKQPREEPFCLYLSHKAVHGPFTPAVRHSKLYEGIPVSRPASCNETLEGKPAWQRQGMEGGHDSKGALGSDEGFERFVKDYNRTLVAVDEGVGRVLSALEEAGVLDSTVVVFAGDNGYFQGEHGRLDKRAAYEESIRIPIVIRYPKMIPARTLIDRMVLNIDIAPTFLDLAGVQVPSEMQGRSFKPLLQGRTKNWRGDFLYEYFRDPTFPRTPTMQGVRTDRWKYIEYTDIEDLAELYDLQNDPTEMRNLVDEDRYKGVVVDMRSRLHRLINETKGGSK